MEADQDPFVEENGLPEAEIVHLLDCFGECHRTFRGTCP